MSSEIRFNRAEQAGGSPAWPLILEGHFWLSNDGMAPHDRRMATSWDSEVMYATIENEVVGVLCWKPDQETRDWVVSLIYVESSSRHLGIGKSLLTSLKTMAQADKTVQRIVCEVHKSNDKFIKTLEEFKAEQVSVVCIMDVGDKAPAVAAG